MVLIGVRTILAPARMLTVRSAVAFDRANINSNGAITLDEVTNVPVIRIVGLSLVLSISTCVDLLNFSVDLLEFYNPTIKHRVLLIKLMTTN